MSSVFLFKGALSRRHLEKSGCNSLCLLTTMTHLEREIICRTDSAGDFGPTLKDKYSRYVELGVMCGCFKSSKTKQRNSDLILRRHSHRGQTLYVYEVEVYGGREHGTREMNDELRTFVDCCIHSTSFNLSKNHFEVGYFRLLSVRKQSERLSHLSKSQLVCTGAGIAPGSQLHFLCSFPSPLLAVQTVACWMPLAVPHLSTLVRFEVAGWVHPGSDASAVRTSKWHSLS